MNILFRRLSDEKVEDQMQDLIVMCVKSEDVHIQVIHLFRVVKKIFLNQIWKP